MWPTDTEVTPDRSCPVMVIVPPLADTVLDTEVRCGPAPCRPCVIGRVAPRYAPLPAMTSTSRERITCSPLSGAWITIPSPA